MAQEQLLAELEGYLRGVNPMTRQTIMKSARGGMDSAKEAAKAAKKGEMQLTSGESIVVHICLRAMYPGIKPWSEAKKDLDKATEGLSGKDSKNIRKALRKAGDLTGIKEMMMMYEMREDKKAEMVEQIYDDPEDFTEDVRLGTVAAWLQCKNKRSEKYHHKMSMFGSTALALGDAQKAGMAIENMASVVPMKKEAQALHKDAEVLIELARIAYGSRAMEGHLQNAMDGIRSKVSGMANLALKRSVLTLLMLVICGTPTCVNAETVEEFCRKKLNQTEEKVYVHCFNEDDGRAMTLAALILGCFSMLYILIKAILMLLLTIINGRPNGSWDDLKHVVKCFSETGSENFARDIMVLESRRDGEETSSPEEGLGPPLSGFNENGVFMETL
uniref:Polyprotein p42 n=1 Tax=Influenza D virus TaxID=1511084 RepID=A0A7D4W982_9ORTO|nr:P42 [Influenza D virus]QKU36021.1 P42 [Influenza D virus]QKU36053.1 P42 [Influenza D virus]QKU36085.1 P42 [Influenza D virus]QKU36164.1 P42 [Influenza D virus]